MAPTISPTILHKSDVRQSHAASRSGGGIDGDLGLSNGLTSEEDERLRRMYGRGGGFFCCSTGEVKGEMGETGPRSSKPSFNARGGGRSTIASRSYKVCVRIMAYADA